MKHTLDITLNVVAEAVTFAALPFLAGRMTSLAVFGFVAVTWLGMGFAFLPVVLLAWGACYATVLALYGSASGFVFDRTCANPVAALRFRRDMTRQDRMNCLEGFRKSAWQFR